MNDELLELYGEYYTSDFVEKNMPWIKEIPFGEWLDRHMREGEKHESS